MKALAAMLADLHNWIRSGGGDNPVLFGFVVFVAAMMGLLFLKGLAGKLFPERRSKAVSRRLSFFQKHKLIRQAEYLMDDGHFSQAGALLDSIGEFERALQAYLKGNELVAAASLAEKIQ